MESTEDNFYWQSRCIIICDQQPHGLDLSRCPFRSPSKSPFFPSISRFSSSLSSIILTSPSNDSFTPTPDLAEVWNQVSKFSLSHKKDQFSSGMLPKSHLVPTMTHGVLSGSKLELLWRHPVTWLRDLLSMRLKQIMTPDAPRKKLEVTSLLPAYWPLRSQNWSLTSFPSNKISLYTKSAPIVGL